MIVVQGNQSFCGIGGCQYRAFTWDASSHRFAPLRGPSVTAHRYLAKTRHFQAIQLPYVAGLFGFLEAQGSHLAILSRTYDVWQHATVTPIRYVEGVRGVGSMQLGFKERCLPTTPEPIPLNTPYAVLEAFLEALPLVVPSNRQSVWKSSAPLSWLATTLTFLGQTPHETHTAGGVVLTSDIAGFRNLGGDQGVRLYRYHLSATIIQKGSQRQLTGLTLKPIQ